MDRFSIIKDLRIINAISGIIFIFLVATISHFLFSHLGFNPTDDGWVLAGSRRIIEGQIPHRDFISFHAAGSHFIHIPFVLFGGDYVFLISRYFVWIQFASIAWIWTVTITGSFKVFHTMWEKFAVALIAFSFSANYFPIMAWYTIDGLFLVSLGIMLCSRESRSMKIIGYLILGTAPLCKQVFLPMIPISIILLNDWRKVGIWIMSSIPIIFFGVYLAIYRAIPDAILQLTTHRGFISVGVTPYINIIIPWGIIVGGLAAYMIHGFRDPKPSVNKTKLLSFLAVLIIIGVFISAILALMKGSILGYLELIIGGLAAYLLYNALSSKPPTRMINVQRLLGVLILFGIIFGAAWTLATGSIFGYFQLFHLSTSFVIFSAVIGEILYFIIREQKVTNYLQFGLLAVFVAWCTSLSLGGYNSPVLATGPLVLFLLASVRFSSHTSSFPIIPNNIKSLLLGRLLSPKKLQMIINVLVILSAVSSLIAFGIARQNNIYREQSATYLTYDLGDVLPGAKGIKTNENTYRFLRDLQQAKNIAEQKGKKYCIIPDMAANWVKDSQSNPLPSDWPNNYDLGRKELLDKAIKVLEENRGTIIIIVQKYEARSLARGFTPLSDKYVIVNYVHSNFHKMGETQYFELYE